MIPKLDVLCRKNEAVSSEIIEKFEAYFFPLFRSIEDKSFENFKNTICQGPVRFFRKTAKGYIACEFGDTPDLMLSCYEPEKEQIYVDAVCEFLNNDTHSKEVLQIISDFKNDILTVPRKGYSFSIEPYKIWAIASVQRPDPEEAPFTIAFKTTAEEMFELFFVFLSMDHQWGFFDTDMYFLQALWESKKEEFKVSGSFDENRFEEIMARPEYKSYFIEAVRPTVHRKNIAQVKRILDRELDPEFINQ